MVPLPNQNTVGVCNQITLLILCYIRYRLSTLLKDSEVHILVSDTVTSLLLSSSSV